MGHFIPRKTSRWFIDNYRQHEKTLAIAVESPNGIICSCELEPRSQREKLLRQTSGALEMMEDACIPIVPAMLSRAVITS